MATKSTGAGLWPMLEILKIKGPDRAEIEIFLLTGPGPGRDLFFISGAVVGPGSKILKLPGPGLEKLKMLRPGRDRNFFYCRGRAGI